ncbi:MAG: acyl-CoA thioesterase [Bacteroidia bacterium]
MKQGPKTLSAETEVIVRFSDCDALQMVWHGNYVQYFEDGREDFGRKFEFGYWDVYKQHGLAVPLTHLECDFKKFVTFGEKIKIETTLVDSPAAKIIFEYKIFNQKNELVCTGKTIQVFLHVDKKELMITMPPFFEAWKHKYLK